MSNHSQEESPGVLATLHDAIQPDTEIDPSRIGAFFDVDETLVRGASVYWAAKEMFRRSLFGFRDLGFAAKESFRFILFGEDAGKIDSFTSRAASIVAGTSVEEMQRLGEEIFEKYFVPKVYRATYDLLKAHVAAGHTVYLISATPWLIAEEIAARIGAMGGIGTKVKVHDGLLVGELDGQIIHGEEKVVAVLEVAAENNLDLQQSWAYSDSANDIPMLSTVGHPVAVNPDRALRAYARANGWQILRAHETKDVVLRLAGRVAVFAALGAGTYLVFTSGRKGTRKASSFRAGRA